MNKLFNSISLRYKQAVIITPSTTEGGRRPMAVLGMLTELAALGYTLDKPTMDVLKTFSDSELTEFHDEVFATIKGMIGDDVVHKPLFKNFPYDVPDESYLLRRIVGFVENQFNFTFPEDATPLSCGHVIDPMLFDIEKFGACPICQHQVDELAEESDRTPLTDKVALKVIRLGDEMEIVELFQNLLNAKSSISMEDSNVIDDLIGSDHKFVDYIPSTIPIKENMAVAIGACFVHVDDIEKSMSGFVKTATDVLRVAATICDGDVSLAQRTKFKMSNPMRRLIMGLLDGIKNPEEDMMAHRMRWIRLGEVLHIGQKTKKYPNAARAFDMLRNRPDQITTFNSRVEELVKIISTEHKAKEKIPYAELQEFENELMRLLQKRAGLFARRLDWMLRTFTDASPVVNIFIVLIEKLPTPMLLTISTHLTLRPFSDDTTKRYFMPKGSIAKIQSLKDDRECIDADVVDKIQSEIRDELLLRFGKLEDLGKVYINPQLGGIPVPLAQRSASKSLVTVPRGSHVPLPENDAMRMFLYWKETAESGCVDVDLSAICFDYKWDYNSHISYTDLSSVGGSHSGDVQSAPNGASEFIDIDIATARENGIRYIVMDVISYNGQNFDTFECFAGVMGRDNVDSGKVYESKTVQQKFDVDGGARFNIPFIFDLQANTMIWCDIALTASPQTNVERESGNIVDMAQAIQTMVQYKPTLFNLLAIHAEARGTSISTEREEGVEYDTEYDMDFATKIDDILANYL